MQLALAIALALVITGLVFVVAVQHRLIRRWQERFLEKCLELGELKWQSSGAEGVDLAAALTAPAQCPACGWQGTWKDGIWGMSSNVLCPRCAEVIEPQPQEPQINAEKRR
jgi:hypothetical protein